MSLKEQLRLPLIFPNRGVHQVNYVCNVYTPTIAYCDSIIFVCVGTASEATVEDVRPAHKQNNASTNRPTVVGDDSDGVVDLSDEVEVGEWLQWTEDGELLHGLVLEVNGNVLSIQLSTGGFVDIVKDQIEFDQMTSDAVLILQKKMAEAEVQQPKQYVYLEHSN